MEEVNSTLKLMFKSVLLLILDLLQHGETDRAMQRITEILKDID